MGRDTKGISSFGVDTTQENILFKWQTIVLTCRQYHVFETRLALVDLTNRRV